MNKGLYFQYDDSRAPSVEPQRRMLFFQKLDFYAENNMEKVLLINIDYSAVNRTLEKMNYDTDVFICQGDKIVLSNGISGAFFMNSLKTKFNPDWFDPV